MSGAHESHESSSTAKPGPGETTSLPARRTLYFRLAVAFLGLLIASSLFVLWSFFRSWRDFEAEATQRANGNVAQQIARELQPALSPAVDFLALAERAARINDLSPANSLLLLDESGAVLDLLPRSFPLATNRVFDLAPIRRFIEARGAEGVAIYGDDPLSARGKGVFSAAPVSIGTRPGYVYVFFRNHADNVLASLAGESAAVRTLLFNFATFLALSALVGLWVLKRLTRRFYGILGVVRSWQGGMLTTRVNDRGNDEIGLLARTLDDLTGRIDRNLEELREKDRQRRDLIAAVSHDLRGPVAAVRGHLDHLLVRFSEMPENAKLDALEGMSNGMNALQNLLLGLFELAKLEAKEATPAFEVLDLNELSARIVGSLEPLAAERRIAIGVIGGPEPLRVRADKTLLERVFFNLIGNALSHTEEGGRVGIELEPRRTAVRITVADTGSGIPPGEIEKIFEPFYRGTGSGGAPGAGLGLAIVKRILVLHDSDITVESEVGKGTRLSFLLPRA